MIGYTDSDCGAGSPDDRKSTSNYLFYVGSKLILWSFKKQTTVTISSVEAEYTIITGTACESIYIVEKAFFKFEAEVRRSYSNFL